MCYYVLINPLFGTFKLFSFLATITNAAMNGLKYTLLEKAEQVGQVEPSSDHPPHRNTILNNCPCTFLGTIKLVE